jgi:2-dehydropantoate 2-reductase
MRIAVIGSGAVGGYYGAKLARAGHEVLFVARGAHRRAIEERGLLVWSPLGDFVARGRAVAGAAGEAPVDLVLFAVKTYDNEAAFPLLPPLVGPSTAVLTLQNGIDSAERLALVVGQERVLGGTTYIATALRAPGLVEQTGTYRRVVFGEWFAPAAEPTPRTLEIARALSHADIQAEPVADARVAVWEKFVYLSPLAAFTGAARQPAGAIWDDPDIRAPFLDAVREVERLGRAEGVPLAADVLDRVCRYMDAVPKGMRSSLLIDLSAGKRIEVEALQGAVVRKAQERGVPVPIMSALYAVLKPHALGLPSRGGAPGDEAPAT